MYLQQCYSSIISSPFYHFFYKQVQRQIPSTAVSILPYSKQISNSVNLYVPLLMLIYVELKEYLSGSGNLLKVTEFIHTGCTILYNY
jgi:hypothetical protein